MSKHDDFGLRLVQLQIPNASESIDSPVLVVAGDVSDTDFKISLDEIFSQVSQRYQGDSEALQRFSFYLLLQAKEFAQNKDFPKDVDNIKLVREEPPLI